MEIIRGLHKGVLSGKHFLIYYIKPYHKQQLNMFSFPLNKYFGLIT